MSLLPALGRELRAAARQPFTYNLRLLGVLALLWTLVWFGLNEGGFHFNNIGGRLFDTLHGTLFVAIWVLVPILPADSLSRERREGTLPLLFLTPLRPPQIVWAKGFAHALRALTLFLAAVPVMTVCFVAGGVGVHEVVFSALINFSSICLALAAGLVASAWTRSAARSLALALGLAAGLMAGMLGLLGFLLDLFSPPGAWYGYTWNVVLHVAHLWENIAFVPGGGGSAMLPACIGLAAGSGVALCLMVLGAARRVKRTWMEPAPSARVQRLRRRFLRPVFFAPLLRRWLQWELHRNPVGWLERRNWSSRLLVWSWLAVVMGVYTWLLTDLWYYHQNFHEVQRVLGQLLAGALAFSAVGSFRRERETGVLELLLVAPLGEQRIIFGRLRGLWGQFLPAVTVLCGVWLYCGSFMGDAGEFRYILSYTVLFATLPVVALYFSLVRMHFIAACLWTVALGWFVPLLLGFTARCLCQKPGLGYGRDEADTVLLVVQGGFQVLIAAFCLGRMLANLQRRKFALAG